MHGIYELKEMLCEELEEYGKKGDLSTGSLDVVDKLAHTIKNLDKIIECYEEDGGSYDDGMMNRDENNRGSRRSYRRSYARGGRRYSRNGYSRNADMTERLRELMYDTPDDRTRQEIQNLVNKMEQM